VFCPNCGASNADTATMCAQCNQAIPQFSSSAQPPQPLQPSPAGIPAPLPPGSVAPPQSQVQIPNYLTQSIIMTVVSVLCCSLLSLPFSIIALVYSTQVNGKIVANDIAGALSASKNAKLFCWIAFGVVMAGVLLGIVYFILIMLGAAANIFQQH